MSRRRDILIGAAAILTVGGGWQLWIRRPMPLAFEVMAGLPGWRRIEFTGVTVGGLSDAAFVGLGGGEGESSLLPAPALCEALYPARTTRRTPVAVFSDFFCPFCRRLIQMLQDRQDAGAEDIEVFWHELPLLGRASEMAARGAIAAGLQGFYAPYQEMLAATQFRPTERFLIETAGRLGLDTGRFARDLSGGEVEAALATSRQAAGALGIYGTPAMTIGKTLVMGEVSEAELDRLVALEAGREPRC